MPVACPVCDLEGAFQREGDFSLCLRCEWENDPVQFRDHDSNGGANKMSVRKARRLLRIRVPAILAKPFPGVGWRFELVGFTASCEPIASTPETVGATGLAGDRLSDKICLDLYRLLSTAREVFDGAVVVRAVAYDEDQSAIGASGLNRLINSAYPYERRGDFWLLLPDDADRVMSLMWWREGLVLFAGRQAVRLSLIPLVDRWDWFVERDEADVGSGLQAVARKYGLEFIIEDLSDHDRSEIEQARGRAREFARGARLWYP